MIQGALFDWSAEPEAQITDDEKLATAFQQAFASLVRKSPPPVIEARFYPYVGLSSTIRLRQGRVYVRVSDLLRSAPQDVLYSLASILLAKLYRRKIPIERERAYREHALKPAVVDAADSTRRDRGFKVTTSAKGSVFDLNQLFDQLNSTYFKNQLVKPVLSWGQKPTRRVFGHHDHVHGAIIISPSLDDKRVPQLVVEYVLYHEMLHIKHRAKVVGARTMYHGVDFRRDERRFKGFAEAVEWLEKFASSRRRAARAAKNRTGTKAMKKRL